MWEADDREREREIFAVFVESEGLWFVCLFVCLFSYLEVEDEVVDGDRVFPGIILLHSCQEGLREVETRHPEHGWGSVLVPVLQHTQNCRNNNDGKLIADHLILLTKNLNET